MRFKHLTFFCISTLIVFCFVPLLSASAQGTAFTYQRQLQNNGQLANGHFDLSFSLYDTNESGAAVAGPVTNFDIPVTNGLFTTLVDFGPEVFVGTNNWLAISVSTNNANNFISLSPRQPVTPVPYALMAANANSVIGPINSTQLTGDIPATNLIGVLNPAQLPTDVVTNGSTNVNISGTLTGNLIGTAQTTNGFMGGTSTLMYDANGVYTFTVPTNAVAMQVKLWGAGGQGSTDTGGGGGAFAQKSLAVTPGSTFVVVVGASGGNGGGYGANDASGGLGVTNDSMVAYGNGGQGSSLFALTNSLYLTLAVAGGGGGGGVVYGGNAGQAVGPGGSTVNNNYATNAITTGVASLSLVGGDGLAFNGGGYGGGLPQSDGQANGGGSYGDITAAGSLNNPANTSDPNYVASAGAGGSINGGGNDGLAVVTFANQTPNISSPNLQQIALLKWSPTTADNSFAVGSAPSGICFDGSSIWVVNYGDGTVTKLAASTGAILGTFNVGSEPDSLCFDGSSIWVANQNDDTVTKLNASTGANLGTFNVGTDPHAICFDGTSIWVANQGSASVTKLNASNGANLGTFNVGLFPEGICFDGSSIWVANEGSSSVTKLNASTGANLGNFHVPSDPDALCFDGSSIWVANPDSRGGSGTVTKLNASNGIKLGTFNVGTEPYALCFDGSSIWVANAESGTVTKLNASNGTNVGTFNVGSLPEAICFDGANIWVPSAGNNAVTKL